jgi:hypothetical protein
MKKPGNVLYSLIFCIAEVAMLSQCTHTGSSPSAQTWGEMADGIEEQREIATDVYAVLARARSVATSPIVRRVYRYEDIGKDRTSLDGRAVFLEGQPRQEWFGLAMSDVSSAGRILAELPLLAFAYRRTGDDVYLDRIISQLEEVTTWSPIQRPGWQLYAPSPEPVPEDFWDGSWLATGMGIRAVADTLELLPDGSLDRDMINGIEELLRGEIDTITQDWELGRGWFRRGDGRPGTNQWVLPTEGLVRACLVVGKRRFKKEYELGVTNLLRALDIQGSQGEFNEGIGYALMTVNSMLSAARAMAAVGDARGIDHPFLQGFPAWTVHHLQPGRFRINSFDSGSAKTARNDGSIRGLLSTLTVLTGDPTARWALEHLYDGPTEDLTGLLASGISVPDNDPALYAFYDGPARRVNWRDSWADNATGVWVRGGHPLDAHDHYDRGHVNFIAGGKPLLIEAGTPSYDNPNIHTLYSTVIGHNVLDADGITPKKSTAPITISTLDSDGGDIGVDVTECYPGLERWVRKIGWDAERLEVSDRVVSGSDARLLTFR